VPRLYSPEWQPYGKAASPKRARDAALTVDFPNHRVPFRSEVIARGALCFA